MKKLRFVLASALVLTAPAAAQEPEKIDLRVLVTGIPGSVRLAEFETFLSEHFKKVGTTSYSDFEPQQARGYDVLIIDAEVRPKPGRIGLPRAPRLTAQFDRASVLVAGAGARLQRTLENKIDWL